MEESKQEAIERLFNEYTDSYGRFSLNPVNSPDYQRSENMGLWTGEGGILLKLNNFHKTVNEEYKNSFDKSMKAVNVGVPGLYSRHPAPFWQKKHHNVSKDEYRGFMYGSAVLGKTKLPNEIVDYGEGNYWFYVDDDPFGGIDKDKMGAFRLPTDRCLYNIVAGRKPSLLQLLFLAGSAILNSRKPERDTSSRIMSWFTFKAIEIVGFKSKILSFAKKRFDKNNKKCYNSDYPMESVIGIYFPKEHPFQTLIKGLK